MASRPVFFSIEPGSEKDSRFVEELEVEFIWNAGLAPVQKKKNILALHQKAKRHGMSNVLEVSSKSSSEIGRKLSAFSLRVCVGGRQVFLEAAFQGSKKFETGGPYTDLYDVDGRTAKRDPRLRSSGALTAFVMNDIEWPLVPKTAFYDWLYLTALSPHKDWLERLYEYDGFTDIEFNPRKSINCQARSVALLVALMKRGMLEEALKSREAFLRIIISDSLSQPHSIDLKQGKLF